MLTQTKLSASHLNSRPPPPARTPAFSPNNSIDTADRCYGITLDESNAVTPLADEDGRLVSPNPKPMLTRTYTSLQEHADHIRAAGASTEDSCLTTRRESRREGFSWGLRPTIEEQRRASLNPLPPQQLEADTPPSIEEIIRRRTTSDVSDRVHNINLQRGDSIGSAPSTARLSGNSTTSDEPSRAASRRSSFAAFARGLARHVPDMRMFAPEKPIESKEEPHRGGSQDTAFTRGNRKDRKLSFAPLPAIKSNQSYEKAMKPTPIIEKPTPSETSIRPAAPQPPARGGLKDRRKVNLDLSMPSMPMEMPDLPARGRSTTGGLSSLTPARPRSPKTPWIRNEHPRWEPSATAKSGPIIEEDYIQDTTTGGGNSKQGGLGLLTGTDDPLSSESPQFERPPQKVRDRCYISRPPRSKRSRSGRSGESESNSSRTPDSAWTSDDLRALDEPRELSRTKSLRVRRWRFKTSSDESPQTPDTPSRRFSINLFKRSNRISDQTRDKDKKSNKQPLNTRLGPSSLLADMPVPPSFVPPGVNRIATPPTLDVHSEVKGKLADFFFDVQSGAEGASHRKAKASSGGYWDSDALLMSLTTNIDPDDEDDEEGPEGRTEYVSTPLDFEPNGTPGLVRGDGGYLGVEGRSPDFRMPPSPVLVHQDSWFRIRRDEAADEQALTALALQEEDERRKFEWLVPEHLPNSPLCPLHPKYIGPCQGVCYWHRIKKSGSKKRKSEDYSSEAANGYRFKDQFDEQEDDKQILRTWSSNPGWEVGRVDVSVKEVKKKRRLVSLSSP